MDKFGFTSSKITRKNGYIVSDAMSEIVTGESTGKPSDGAAMSDIIESKTESEADLIETGATTTAATSEALGETMFSVASTTVAASSSGSRTDPNTGTKKKPRLTSEFDKRKVDRNTAEKPIAFERLAFPLDKLLRTVGRLKKLVTRFQEDLGDYESDYKVLNATDAIEAFTELQTKFNDSFHQQYPELVEFILQKRREESRPPLVLPSLTQPTPNGSRREGTGTNYYMVRDDSMLSEPVLQKILTFEERPDAAKMMVKTASRQIFAASARTILVEQRKINKDYIKTTASCTRALSTIHAQFPVDVLQFVHGYAYCPVCDQVWLPKSAKDVFGPSYLKRHFKSQTHYFNCVDAGSRLPR